MMNNSMPEAVKRRITALKEEIKKGDKRLVELTVLYKAAMKANTFEQFEKSLTAEDIDLLNQGPQDRIAKELALLKAGKYNEVH